MAKQGGIHKIRGKVGELSYYQSQVGGFLLRGINQGMSERVKYDPAFANTRLNAAEFGAAGMLAGSLVRGVTQRWRYLLNPVATGKLSSKIKMLMAQDTTHPWGRRQLSVTNMPLVQDLYNSLSKNEMPQDLSDYLHQVTMNENGTLIQFGAPKEISTSTINEWISKGIDGVQLVVFDYVVAVPTYDPASGKYVRGENPFLRPIEALDQPVDEGMDFDFGEVQTPKLLNRLMKPQNEVNHLGGVLFVFLPYTTISNQKHILQEHCACAWYSAANVE